MSAPLDQLSNLISSLVNGRQSEAGRLSFNSTPELSKEIQLGQIVKGRVLRQVASNQYSVELNGRERVVDSSIPMTSDEIIHGRVIGVGDRIEIKRFPQEQLKDQSQAINTRQWQTLENQGGPGKQAVEMFQQYRVNLANNEQTILAQQLRGAQNPNVVMLSALVLNKIGLKLNEELIKLTSKLLNTQSDRIFPGSEKAAILEMAKDAAATAKENTNQFAKVIEKLAHDLPDAKEQTSKLTNESEITTDSDDSDSTQQQSVFGDSAGEDSGERQFFDWGKLLLNAQSDGSVSHRVTTIPFVIAGTLVEVDMAFFSQKQTSVDGIKYQKIVLSLNLERLGEVEIEALIANKHIKVNVTAENEVATQALTSQMKHLGDSLRDGGWIIDQQQYSTRQTETSGEVLRSVVEHYITKDSLSRLY